MSLFQHDFSHNHWIYNVKVMDKIFHKIWIRNDKHEKIDISILRNRWNVLAHTKPKFYIWVDEAFRIDKIYLRPNIYLEWLWGTRWEPGPSLRFQINIDKL